MCRCNSYNLCAYLWSCLSIISTVICILGFYLPVWMEVFNPYLIDGKTNPVVLSTYRACHYPQVTNMTKETQLYSELDSRYQHCVPEEERDSNTTFFYLIDSQCADDTSGCNYGVPAPQPIIYHLYCGRLIDFNAILAEEWKAATLLMGVGSFCLVVTAFISLFGCCIRKLFTIYLTLLVSAVQMLGSLCFVAAIILFLVGLRSSKITRLCSFETCSAGLFQLGICSLGWAYYLTAFGTFLALISSLLSITTACHKNRNHDDKSFAI